MAWMALAGMIGSMAGQAAGGAAANAATKEGAETQAEIERLNREYQQRQFQQNLEKQKPFYEEGKKAIPLYTQAVQGNLDVTNMPLYKMQAERLNQELSKAPSYVKERTLQGLGARESEMQKGRLLDLMKIGLGSSASAGQASINLGTALSRSYQTAGQAMAQGTMTAANQRQSMWNKAMDQASGYPAYRASQQPSEYDWQNNPEDRSYGKF